MDAHLIMCSALIFVYPQGDPVLMLDCDGDEHRCTNDFEGVIYLHKVPAMLGTALSHWSLSIMDTLMATYLPERVEDYEQHL